MIAAEKKERRHYDGKDYILERAITGDFALVRAWKADTKGNLVFRKAARNFNPDCAMAGKICIVEAEEIVPVGSIDPDHVHIPDVYVHRIIKAVDMEKRVEFRTSSDSAAGNTVLGTGESRLKRERIVKRAAKEITDGMYVNLGIGIPTLCSNYLAPGINITLQSENGILGLGPFPKESEIDPDLINAGK